MRIGRRFARVVFWGLVLCLSILGGGLWFAYTYVTDSANAARWIRQYAVKYLPGSELDPGRVRMRPLIGELTLNEARIFQKIGGSPFQTLRVRWLHILVNTRKMMRGELDVQEVDVVQPTLRLCQRADGTWNLQGLLADPWPGPWLDKTPPILIENGTVELVYHEDAATDGADATGDARGVADGAGVGAARTATILREVRLRVDQVGGLLYKFEGSAKGDTLDHVRLGGTVDLATGRMAMEGELSALTLSEAIRPRIPPEARPVFKALGLTGGVVDLDRVRASYDPNAAAGDRLHYSVQARLRDGDWNCPKLPYPVNSLSAAFEVEDGRLTIHRAEGYNGVTTLRARGTMCLGDPRRQPLDLHVDLLDLVLDQRLRDHTPAEYLELWDIFRPSGHVGAEIQLTRSVPDGPVELGASVTCHDVAATYRHFPYPLDHLTGTLTLKKNTLAVAVQTTSVGGQPLHMTGTIEDPGPNAVVKLDITARSVPIDKTLLEALKPEVRKVVEQFKPSGTVKGHAKVSRVPMAGRPEGKIAIDAEIDLSERCEITWVKLPYTIRNLTGRLELHPDLWIFSGVRGRNGQEVITARGSVQKLPGGKLSNGEDPLKVHVELEARNLPFSQELLQALPGEWKNTWRTINPAGASDVKATVDVEPGHEDQNHIVIEPLPESSVRLLVMRSPQPKHLDPGGLIELRMDDVHGRFVFDNGVVNMDDVSVKFRGSPVRFANGTVYVKHTGQFALAVKDLWVKEIRLDSDLRKKMPPLMASFAQKLDDGRTFTLAGDLQIGWSGLAGDPAWCRWDKVKVVLNDNQLKTKIPLEHIQGELSQVKGFSNGLTLQVEGIMELESVVLLGQQITRVQSPFRVQEGVAELMDVRGKFLRGDLWGRGWVTLDATPSYSATMTLRGALLEEYARTVGGNRSYRGNIDARIECNGLGGDIRTLQGAGEAHIHDGNLGELPGFLSLFALLNRTLSPNVPRVRIKTAFDSVDLVFKIAHGSWNLDPIKFTGNALSLLGGGTLDPQSNLDLHLEPLLGRDRFHIPIFSEVSREVSAPLVSVHVTGTLSHPDFKIEPLPPLQRDPARAARRAEQVGRVE